MRWSIPMLLVVCLVGCRADPSADVVGTWGVDLASSRLPSASAEQVMFAQAALAGVKLEIRPDGSFVLNLMRSDVGSWKYDGETLFLSPKPGSRAAKSLRFVEGQSDIKMRFVSGANRLEWELESPLKATLRLMRIPAEAPESNSAHEL